jgi:hypothetical protein
VTAWIPPGGFQGSRLLAAQPYPVPFGHRTHQRPPARRRSPGAAVPFAVPNPLILPTPAARPTPFTSPSPDTPEQGA